MTDRSGKLIAGVNLRQLKTFAGHPAPYKHFKFLQSFESPPS
jgi:hypothetical protein